MWSVKILIFGLIYSTCKAQNEYKICATVYHVNQCTQLQRGNSQVKCHMVQDSIECANCLRNGTAHLGTFTAESALHLAVLNWDGLTVIKQLRHESRIFSDVDYESVVIVRSDHQGGLSALKGRKYCHPGLYYSKNQKWTEGFLKNMERKVVQPQCNIGKSVAEIEVSTLSEFFGPSCRPGIWSHDTKEDAALKKKYSSLCQLCPGKDCKYDDIMTSGPDKQHQQALNCLKNDGHVAYVSRQDADYFFSKEGYTSEFKYLCPNNTLETIVDNKSPCVWLRQPWRSIIAYSEKAVAIEKLIDIWFRAAKSNPLGWESSVIEILGTTNFQPYPTYLQLPAAYIRQYRGEIPIPEPYCNTELSWCTTTMDENEKCTVVRAGGISSGVRPFINCRDPTFSTVSCLDEISKNNSDFMGIDSNYGYLARKAYNLTAAMYFETEVEQYSSVVVVVHADSNIKKFEELRNKRACLPEFGATPSIAFINFAKEKKIFKKNECRYGHLLHTFFGDSCAPGAQDWKYNVDNIVDKDDNADTLCSLCLVNKIRGNTEMRTNASNLLQPRTSMGTCAADISNQYFGNRGALKCLQEVGDVAILELQSLQQHAIDIGVDDSQFRVLCRNGTLAHETGFDVDLGCALTTIVDGEIVVHRHSPKTSSIVNALKALDTYFQIDPDFRMYNVYNGIRNLLFKDSTLGVSATNEDNHGQTVKNYIELFKNIEQCVGSSGAKYSFNIMITIIVMVSSFFIN